MTLEEIAKLYLDAAIAELTYFWNSTPKESERYVKLRSTIFAHYMEQLTDREFGEYLMRSNGLFAKVMADHQAALRAKKILESEEGRAAMDSTMRYMEGEGRNK